MFEKVGALSASRKESAIFCEICARFVIIIAYPNSFFCIYLSLSAGVLFLQQHNQDRFISVYYVTRVRWTSARKIVVDFLVLFSVGSVCE